MIDNLLPCPFCGYNGVSWHYYDKELCDSKFAAFCHNCGAHGPFSKTPDEAMIEWNRRAEDHIRKVTKKIEPEQCAKNAHWITDTFHGNDVMSGGSMVICSECNKGKYNGPTKFCPNCGAKMEEEKKARWIPVSERPPEEGMEVLVACADGTMRISALTDITYWKGIGRGNVLAWMQLPESYQEEE